MQERITFSAKFTDLVTSTLTYFFYHFERRSPSQFTDMIADIKALFEIFPEERIKYSKDLENLIKNPLQFFILNNEDYFKEKKIDERRLDFSFTLPNLEFIYYRDTSFNIKLNTPYPVLYSRNSIKRVHLTLSELTDIMSFIKIRVKSLVTDIIKRNNLPSPLVLPDVQSHEQKQVGINENY